MKKLSLAAPCLPLLVALLSVAVPVRAQSPAVPRPMEDVNKVRDLTLDSINIANTARPVPGSSRVGDHPVLFLVGNSTMRTGTLGNGNNGQWGWGRFASMYFDASRITVENHALGGTSSRTFYRRLWPAVLEGVRPGDWVLVELGHNDNGPYDSGRARASIPGIGTDSLVVTIKETGEEETVYSYGEYMRRFIRDVRAKGAHPVLCSLTPRNSWEADGTVTRKTETFTRWQKEICAEMNVPFVDLEGTSARRFQSFGPHKMAYHFYLDNIHSSAFGARHNALCVAEAIAACPELELAQYLTPRDDWYPRYDVPAADAWKPTVYFCGDSTMQNEDNPDKADSMWGWANETLVTALFKTIRKGEHKGESAVRCVNAAKAGRSARTYLDEGRWEKVYNSLRPGDYVVIQFGHNDMGDIAGGKARADINGAADSSHVYRLQSDRTYKVVYSYGWYLRKFIEDVREKGATPIVCSMTPRNEWPDAKHIERRPGTCATWAREVAEEQGVTFIDIHNLTADWLDAHCAAKTSEDSKAKAAAWYQRDHTHASLLGAKLNGQMFAKGLKASDCSLKEYLK